MRSVTVAAEPVADADAFTWARVRARQCVEGTIYLAAPSEKAYFHSLCVQVLEKCNASGNIPKLPVPDIRVRGY